MIDPLLELDASKARSMRLITLVLAIACGATVANLYYCQPLLPLLSDTFGVSQGTAAVVVTLTQLGYAFGMLFLLPLGDLLENRKFASRTLLATTVALLIAAFAKDFALFAGMSVLIGVTSVVAQILIPFAAHLAPEAERGRFVGRVMSGLLLGILLARTVASLVAAQWGWRSVYVISAVLMLATSLALVKVLPTHRPQTKAKYPQLLRSLGMLVRTEPALRRRAACQALMFGTFSCFWTSIAYELIDEHGFSQTAIGLFALVGAAGALAAPIAGRLADHGHSVIGSGSAIALAFIAMLLAGFGSANIVVLAAAAVLLDLGVQGHQVFSQQEIYSLRGDARARINTVFMTTVFIGGAIASGLSGLLHEQYGWRTVAFFGACLPLVALSIWGVATLRRRSSRRLVSSPR
ncbi:MFS transporter [Jatrophihabitans sp. GAS493]|uniref:MFS transporter n=1 Tax=Jatrophihabitans sp. GAS493 TaxID=1907575 RepID=UPI001A7E129D|nr:MFS transporter [Jatrophihabitans sp. GAS493]